VLRSAATRQRVSNQIANLAATLRNAFDASGSAAESGPSVIELAVVR
jgi:hypothetical protein